MAMAMALNQLRLARPLWPWCAHWTYCISSSRWASIISYSMSPLESPCGTRNAAKMITAVAGGMRTADTGSCEGHKLRE